MREKMWTKRETLIEQIIDRDADDNLGARAAMRAKLREKSFEELERIWKNGSEWIK